MGKPTGFKEYKRELPAKLTVEERIKHYREFVLPYDPNTLNQQAARCMNCGVPFCHNGCPLGNIIPEFNHAVYNSDWEEAYEILISTNNFPEFTGRICPAPCEAACVLGINKPAIAIEEIEKHIIETAFEKRFVKPQKPFYRTEKKVAVIGSGPAGLAAAAQLNYSGHWVTVFEKGNKPGGLLRYGIPDFKLEKNIIDRRIHILEKEGIVFKCNVHVGHDLSADQLLQTFDCIVLATGSTVPRALNIPGSDAKGVHFAMELLSQQNKRNANEAFTEPPITADGKHVVVIGGGDTGSDCVGTANRQGATTITQFELLPQPPQSRTEYMPWPSYPMLLKTTSSHEEGAERKWAVATKAFIANAQGELEALQIVDLEWKLGKDNKPSHFEELTHTTRTIPCNLALLALGFVHTEHSSLLEKLKIDTDDRGNIKASETAFVTNQPNVFATGDARRGQSLVVWAITEGRSCAKKVDEYLNKVQPALKHTDEATLSVMHE